MLNKISDNDIKKALECCVIDNNCSKCPHYNNGKIQTRECLETSIRAALAYVNRLETENERLEDAIDEQDIEISKLYKRIDKAKAEAYKEFADKVKKLPYYPSYTNLHKAVDNLLKEMVGEDSV